MYHYSKTCSQAAKESQVACRRLQVARARGSRTCNFQPATRNCVALLLAAACAMLALPYSTAAQDPSGLALPPGVKAVWDPAKAYHETTPTRERLCINGLWRWQPAADDALQVPTAAWGYYKVQACWPGIQDYLQSDYQTLYPDPSWTNKNLSEVQSAWYERTITIPQD